MYIVVPVIFYASERATRRVREKNYGVTVIKVSYRFYKNTTYKFPQYTL